MPPLSPHIFSDIFNTHKIEQIMDKRILVISNEKSLTQVLYNDLGKRESIELINEPHGSHAYKRIKEIKPDLMIVDLETPGLAKSWVAIQLEGVDIKKQVPTVALSSLLSHEEREILTDLTGFSIHSKDAPISQLNECIEASLVQ